MALRVLAGNLKDGFGNPETALDQVKAVLALKPRIDVGFFSEAYAADDEAFSSLTIVDEQFDIAGYQSVRGLYRDTDNRADSHGMWAISRPEAYMEPVRLASRFGMLMSVEGPETQNTLSLIGGHYDDRSNELRIPQLQAALRYTPEVIFGDLNATHGRDTYSRLMNRVMQAASKRLAYSEPMRGAKLRDPGRVGNVTTRLAAATSVKTLGLLDVAGYIDADRRHRPTFPMRFPFVQLDHIMVASGMIAYDFRRHRLPHTDHLAVSASIERVAQGSR